MAQELIYSYSLVDANIVSATTAATDFPATNAVLPLEPYNPWRSTTKASDQTLTIGGPSAGTGLAQLVLIDCNAPQCKLQMNRVGSWEGLPGYSADHLFDITLDEEDGFYKLSNLVTPIQTGVELVRAIFPSGQTTRDGQNYYEVGSFFWFTARTQLLRSAANPVEVEFNPNEETLELSGRREIQQRGHPYVTMTFRNLLREPEGELSQWNTLKLLGQRTPVCWNRNRGNPQEVYWMQYEGVVRLREGPAFVETVMIWRSVL